MQVHVARPSKIIQLAPVQMTTCFFRRLVRASLHSIFDPLPLDLNPHRGNESKL
ncbi:uncharacterized protein FOMMEDRAFT_17571, partial [Fomitiporia mediterranea MF3/22]|uniref:uncharacterized protein n=1 Tax=Fomitiporia mediterranea (strain MF3/22) TaxID=694068 RepID=UPI0004408306